MHKALTNHEIRDPIHVFVRMDSDERKVVNSPQFQRLRYIHQLALTYLVYPGATHRRFEHCLGVMELAGKVYDVITDQSNVHPEMRYLVPQSSKFDHAYWRRVVRMAALCHDLGHLPFSHAAEGLLPSGIKHEKISRDIILHESMASLWKELKLDPEHVAKVAVGPKYAGSGLDEWESILYEIIGGDVFGADRIDYLLRDSYHAGAAYGRFDHFRLIDTLRILPKAEFGPSASAQIPLPMMEIEQSSLYQEGASTEPMLGIERGGLQSAESLLWARYFMYTQIYMHSSRRVYDLHLEDFFRLWLPNGLFSPSPSEHLLMTDNEVMVAILSANRDPTHPAHKAASCIVSRRHFRPIYEANPHDRKIRLNALELIHDALVNRFGEDRVKKSTYTQTSEGKNFPVLMSSGTCVSSLNLSDTLARAPVFSIGYVYVDPDIRDLAISWLEADKKRILS